MNTFALYDFTAEPFLSCILSTYRRHIRSLALGVTLANFVVREIVRYWPPELDRIIIWVNPRKVNAWAPEQFASEIAQNVLRIVKDASHRESPSLERIFNCFELFQEQWMTRILASDGTYVCTNEVLDAAFQEKLRELLLATDCDLEPSEDAAA